MFVRNISTVVVGRPPGGLDADQQKVEEETLMKHGSEVYLKEKLH